MKKSVLLNVYVFYVHYQSSGLFLMQFSKKKYSNERQKKQEKTEKKTKPRKNKVSLLVCFCTLSTSLTLKLLPHIEKHKHLILYKQS